MRDDIPDEIEHWIGERVVSTDGVMQVEAGAWRNFCAALRDGNTLYWDNAFADTYAGGPTAPPAMLPSWCIDYDWKPGSEPPQRTLELHFRLKDALGLAYGIVKKVDYRFGIPVRAGDTVHSAQILRDLGKPEETAKGPGRRWVIEVEYRNQRNEWLGSQVLYFVNYGTVS